MATVIKAGVTDAAGVRVRPLAAEDLDEADRICRVAFGTFVGVPEPERFFGDADLVRTRWQADPGAALAAELDGRLAGSNFAANWGSVGFFGPLTVAPEYWDRAIAQRLLDATMDLFAAWQTRHAGLFIFAERQACGPVPEIRLLAAFPYRRHDQPGTAGSRPPGSGAAVRGGRG
jgi:GNAT superfamily N-acetyltransferase